MPLTTPDGFNLGTLCAIDTEPRELDPEQLAALSDLAAMVLGDACGRARGLPPSPRCRAVTVRASSLHRSAPSEALRDLNGVLLAEGDGNNHFCTVVVTRVRPVVGGAVVELAAGDALVLFTDGITEARRADGQLFGDERLQDLLAGCGGATADGMATAVVAAVRAFAHGRRHRPGGAAAPVAPAPTGDRPQ